MNASLLFSDSMRQPTVRNEYFYKQYNGEYTRRCTHISKLM